MISLASEMTDTKGRRANGWLFFDADCAFCTALARRLRPALESRGFGLAPLQSARVRAMLGLPEEELLREMRALAPDGGRHDGIDAVLLVARRIWWLWPLYALARLPGAHRWLARAYRWVAAHRNCSAAVCALHVAKEGNGAERS